jgi:dihydrofolate reductase
MAAYELKGREQEEAGALLVGRVSWDAFHPVWPTMAEFDRYNAIPKYVVSTTLTDDEVAASTWKPATLLRSMADVAALKETEGGEIQVHGSATLAQNLAAAGLVDRYHLLVFPLVLGHGKRLFPAEGGGKHPLRLVEHDTYANGIQKLCYEVVR